MSRFNAYDALERAEALRDRLGEHFLYPKIQVNVDGDNDGIEVVFNLLATKDLLRTLQRLKEDK